MRAILTVLATIAILFFALRYFANLDVVSSEYSTLDAAREDVLFDRGWLPDVLPESAINIRTNNDLDINISWGEFSFDPKDYPTLLSNVRVVEDVSSYDSRWVAEINSARTKGLEVLAFVNLGSTWLFFCNPEAGSCTYDMWPNAG